MSAALSADEDGDVEEKLTGKKNRNKCHTKGGNSIKRYLRDRKNLARGVVGGTDTNNNE